MSHRTCIQCDADISLTHANQRYCGLVCRNAKKYRERDRVPCMECGKPSGVMAATSRTDVRCQPCRRADPKYRVQDKRARGFVDSWTCAGCGVSCERPSTKGQRPKWCITCRLMRQNSYIRVAPSVRRAIYARDGWACWICQAAVDASLIGSMDVWRPSLDHVVPKSKGGTDDVSNLNLAHLWCNSARNDERFYTVGDFRV